MGVTVKSRHPRQVTSKVIGKAANTTSKTKPSKPAAPSKPTSSHPSWKDIIRECITAHTSEARLGVSRSVIKKFAEEKYKIEMNGLQVSQLNRAIASGAEHGIFSLPKGPSGKVKLASKVKTNVLKENNQQPVTKKVASKETAPAKPTKKKATPTTKPSTSKKTSTAKTTKKQASAKAAVAKAVKTKAVKAPAKGKTPKEKVKKAST